MSIKKRDRKPSKPTIKKSKSKKTDGQKQQTPGKNSISSVKKRVPCFKREEFHDTFLSYAKITDFLMKVHKDHPKSVNVAVIGHSKAGKPICMVQITSANNTDSPKFVTFIEAGLNGKDVFAVANCLHIIDYLSKNSNCLCVMDYFICPCGNPDAYDKFIESKTNSEAEKGQKKANKRDSNKKCPKSMYDDESVLGEGCSGCAKVNCNKRKGEEKTDETRNDNNKNSTDVGGSRSNKQEKDDIGMDLTNNFPVILGLTDMRKIQTPNFLDKIKIWKENYIKDAPEPIALLSILNSYQFSIKLMISLHDGGESICYPYGFVSENDGELRDLQEVARKGKSAIPCRNFQFGSYYDIRGMTYGTLIDFLKIDKASIKYLYAIQVHAKNKKYDEEQELKNLRVYGCQMMECIKRMSCCVYKLCTNMTGNKEVELVRTKPGLERKRSF